MRKLRNRSSRPPASPATSEPPTNMFNTNKKVMKVNICIVVIANLRNYRIIISLKITIKKLHQVKMKCSDRSSDDILDTINKDKTNKDEHKQCMAARTAMQRRAASIFKLGLHFWQSSILPFDTIEL